MWDIFYKLNFRQTYVRNVVLGTVEVLSRVISLATEPFDTLEPLSRTVGTQLPLSHIHLLAPIVSSSLVHPSLHFLTLRHVLPIASPDGVYADRQSVDK